MAPVTITPDEARPSTRNVMCRDGQREVAANARPLRRVVGLYCNSRPGPSRSPRRLARSTQRDGQKHWG